jgi:hypothetical protein
LPLVIWQFAMENCIGLYRTKSSMACTSQTVPKSSEGKGYEYPINNPPFYQNLRDIPRSIIPIPFHTLVPRILSKGQRFKTAGKPSQGYSTWTQQRQGNHCDPV